MVKDNEQDLALLSCPLKHITTWPRYLRPYPEKCPADIITANCGEELTFQAHAKIDKE